MQFAQIDCPPGQNECLLPLLRDDDDCKPELKKLVITMPSTEVQEGCCGRARGSLGRKRFPWERPFVPLQQYGAGFLASCGEATNHWFWFFSMRSLRSSRGTSSRKPKCGALPLPVSDTGRQDQHSRAGILILSKTDVVSFQGDPRCLTTVVAEFLRVIKDRLLVWVSRKTFPKLNPENVCQETSNDAPDVSFPLNAGNLSGDEVCTLARVATSLINEGRASELPRLMYCLPLPRRRAVSNHTCPSEPCPLLLTAVTNQRLSAGEVTRVATFLLAECGSEVNVEKDGFTPLHFAVLKDSVDLVDLLVEHGSDCSVYWPGGTPLIYVPASLGRRQVAHALCVGLGAKHSPLVTSLCDASVVTTEEQNASLSQRCPTRSTRIVEIHSVELLGSFLVDTGEDSCQTFDEGLTLLTEAMHSRYLDPSDVIFKNEDFINRRLVLSREEAVNPEELDRAARSDDIFQQSFLTTKRILGNPSLLFSALVRRASHYRKATDAKRSCFFYLRKASQVLREESPQPMSRKTWLRLPWASSEGFVENMQWLLDKGCEDKLVWPMQETFLSFCVKVLDQAKLPQDFEDWSKTWQESCFQIVKMVLSNWDDALLPDRVRESVKDVVHAEQRVHSSRCPNLLLCAVLDAAESEDNDVLCVLTDLWEDLDTVVDVEGNTVLHRCLKLRPPQCRLMSVLDVAWIILQSGKGDTSPANKAGESVRDLLWELLSECAREQSKGERLKG